MKDVLWVTSCATDMWRASGGSLVSSFIMRKVTGRLLVCTEGLAADFPSHPSVLRYSLDDDEFLQTWLRDNAAYIPATLGGKLPEPLCTCPGGPYPADPKPHKPACPGSWWQKNHSRWFRKVASLRHALTLVDPKTVGAIVWVDSDCRFSSSLRMPEIRALFANAHCFYVRGTRAVMEAGVVGYLTTPQGRKLLHEIEARYVTGRYRKSPRWDDSAQIQEAIATTRVPARDLVRPQPKARKMARKDHVVERSPLGRFLTHDKGRHGRILGLMT